MKTLIIQGWLTRDEEGLLAVNKERDDSPDYARSIQLRIHDTFSQYIQHYDNYLGGEKAIIPNASIRVYATNKECDLTDAMSAFVGHIDGILISNLENYGYSEWTILGYYCAEFKIGAHDLDKELNRYIGKYIHFVFTIKS